MTAKYEHELPKPEAQPADAPPFDIDLGLMSATDFGNTSAPVLIEKYYFREPRRPFERRKDAETILERGIMPILSNGFSFVVDRRPEGQEADYIPAEEYTSYFSRRQIPLAGEGHKLRNHDIGHIPSYQTMFGVTAFANLVQTTATHALADIELCHQFTNGMDGFGDAMNSIESARYMGTIYTNQINAARLQLKRLIDLLPADASHASPDDPNTTLFEHIWSSLGLEYDERVAVVEKMQEKYFTSSYRDYDYRGHSKTTKTLGDYSIIGYDS